MYFSLASCSDDLSSCSDTYFSPDSIRHIECCMLTDIWMYVLLSFQFENLNENVDVDVRSGYWNYFRFKFSRKFLGKFYFWRKKKFCLLLGKISVNFKAVRNNCKSYFKNFFQEFFGLVLTEFEFISAVIPFLNSSCFVMVKWTINFHKSTIKPVQQET